MPRIAPLQVQPVKMIVLLLCLVPIGASAEKACYPDLGCFNNLPPFYDLPDRPISHLPESRQKVGTEFVLNTPANNFDFLYDIISNLVPGSLEASSFDPDLETKFLVHGYGESGYSNWLEAMGRAFLSVGDYNVIRVDWFPGAFEFYPNATSNARLVGAEISLLMDNIMALYPGTVAADPANYHIIGYSLGAHVAGYAGERQPGLARITGLDPSAPYFENTAIAVRLDPTDADFVDVYHTDASPEDKLGYGIYRAVGHVDVYPNGGIDQPGCDSSITQNLPLNSGGVYDRGIVFVACSHRRAHEIFIESIYKGDEINLAVLTPTQDISHLHQAFDEASPEFIDSFSEASYDPALPVNTIAQRLTDATTSYGYQYRITFTFEDKFGADDAVGILFLTINGISDSVYRKQLGDTGTYEPGSTHVFYVIADPYPGTIDTLGFYWEYDRDWYKPWSWDIFINPDVYIDRIELVLLEDGQRLSFCGDRREYRSMASEDRIIDQC